MVDIPFDMGNVWECACLTFTNADKCEKCGMENNALFLQTFDYSNCLPGITINHPQMVYCNSCHRKHGNISVLQKYRIENTCVYKFLIKCLRLNSEYAEKISLSPELFIKKMDSYQTEIVNSVLNEYRYAEYPNDYMYHYDWEFYRKYVNIYIFIACRHNMVKLFKHINHVKPMLFDYPYFGFSLFSIEIQRLCWHICIPESLDEYQLRDYAYVWRENLHDKHHVLRDFCPIIAKS